MFCAMLNDKIIYQTQNLMIKHICCWRYTGQLLSCHWSQKWLHSSYVIRKHTLWSAPKTPAWCVCVAHQTPPPWQWNSIHIQSCSQTRIALPKALLFESEISHNLIWTVYKSEVIIELTASKIWFLIVVFGSPHCKTVMLEFIHSWEFERIDSSSYELTAPVHCCTLYRVHYKSMHTVLALWPPN